MNLVKKFLTSVSKIAHAILYQKGFWIFLSSLFVCTLLAFHLLYPRDLFTADT